MTIILISHGAIWQPFVVSRPIVWQQSFPDPSSSSSGGGHFVKLVDMNGKPKGRSGSKSGASFSSSSEIHFDFPVESIVALHGDGQLLAFHKHGLQGRWVESGNDPMYMWKPWRETSYLKFPKLSSSNSSFRLSRSFKTNEVTQETCDESKEYRLLGSDSLCVLESKPVDDPEAYCNLYLLRGHEDLRWWFAFHF